MKDCVFCRIVAGEIPAERLWETDDMLAFRDANPAAPVHILLVPKKHIATMNETGPGDEAVLGRMMAGAARLAKGQGIADAGYRLILNCNRDGGQEVFHIHLHLLGGRPLGPMVVRK